MAGGDAGTDCPCASRTGFQGIGLKSAGPNT
jgi:hypothetical protein